MGLRTLVRSLLANKSSLAPGDLAPELGIPDATGKVWSLADLGDHPTVLYFYPKDDTPGCTKEACNFRDRYAEIEALGARILGVSVDDGASHRAFSEKFRLPFPLLSDTDGSVTRAYGVVGGLGLLKVAQRVTFLLDDRGRIAKVFDSVNVAKHTDEVIAAIKELKASA